MILTVTLNPALDITYHVDALTPGATHRVSRVDERLGGKGLNVASVLAQLGEPVVATGLLHEGPPNFSPIAAHPRRTVVVTDGRDATGFWEPGPVVTPDEWAAFRADFARLAASARVVVFSGSLPGGLPDHAYAALIGLARTAGCLTILDTSGPALAHGFAASPDIVKPNATELAHLLSPRSPSPPGEVHAVAAATASTGHSTRHRESAATPGSAANRSGAANPDSAANSPRAGDAAGPSRGGDPAGIASRGGDVGNVSVLWCADTSQVAVAGQVGGAARETVVVESHGAEGLRALGWSARPPRHIEGNPTGAGDACVAALARGLLHGTEWPELLRDAVALSAAAVASPVAGHVDLELYQALRPEVKVEAV